MNSRSVRFTTVSSPLGELRLEASEVGLTAIRFPTVDAPLPSLRRDDEGLAAAAAALRAYFARELLDLALPLDPVGTPFQRAVWTALRDVPYGKTASYGAIAAAIGKPSASRAVGRANGQNPLPIVIPCHRIVGGDGSLTGYTGGLHIKRALLALEGIELALAA